MLFLCLPFNVLIYIWPRVESLQLPYILSVLLLWVLLKMFLLKISLFIYPCYPMTVRWGTYQKCILSVKAKASADHPCWLHLPENVDCVCSSLIDVLTSVTGMMCFPRKHLHGCEVQYGVMNRLEPSVCVCAYVHVCDSHWSVNFRRCLR